MIEKLCLRCRSLFPSFLRHSFSLAWGFANQAWLTGHEALGIFLFQPSQHWDYMPDLSFTFKTKPETHFGDRIQVFMLAGLALWTHWNFSQALFWSLASRLYCLAVWLTSQKAPDIFLSLSPQSWRKGNLPSYEHYLFYFFKKNSWVLGDQIQVLYWATTPDSRGCF